jgi:RNA polymerase sigma-70 factor (ECF subfamily)
MISDTQLVTLAQSGHREALGVLYDRYLPAIYRYCYWQTNRSQDAEDLAADIMLAMVKSLPTFQNRASFKNWLYQIAKNILARYFKKKAQLPLLALDDNQGAVDWIVPVAQSKKRRHLLALLATLSEREARILRTHYLEGATYAEVSRIEGTTVGNIKVIVHRALAKLREV